LSQAATATATRPRGGVQGAMGNQGTCLDAGDSSTAKKVHRPSKGGGQTWPSGQRVKATIDLDYGEAGTARQGTTGTVVGLFPGPNGMLPGILVAWDMLPHLPCAAAQQDQLMRIAKDAPGAYILTVDSTIISDLPGMDEALMRLPAGSEVQVLKVVHCADKRQWRGWVEHPVHGWIALLGTEDGSRWAERLSDEACSSTAEAPGPIKKTTVMGCESPRPPVTTAAVILSREQSHRSRSVPKPNGTTSNTQISVITAQAVSSTPPRRSQSVPHVVQQPASCGAAGVAGSQLRAASPLIHAGHAWHKQQVAGSPGASGSLSAAAPPGPPGTNGSLSTAAPSGTSRTASAQRAVQQAQPLQSRPSRTLTPPPAQQPVARPSIAQPVLRTAQPQLPNVQQQQQQQQTPQSWQQQAQHRQVSQAQCPRATDSNRWALPLDGPVEHQPSRARTAPLLAPSSMRNRSPSVPGPQEQVATEVMHDRARSRERSSPHEPEAAVGPTPGSNGQPGGREHELAMVISRLKGMAAQQSPRPYGSRRPPGLPLGADGTDGSEAGRGRDRGAKSLRWSDL